MTTLFKEEQLSIQAKEEESEKLAKVFERERRIQMSFLQVCFVSCSIPSAARQPISSCSPLLCPLPLHSALLMHFLLSIHYSILPLSSLISIFHEPAQSILIHLFLMCT